MNNQLLVISDASQYKLPVRMEMLLDISSLNCFSGQIIVRLLFIYFRLCERRFKSQQSLEYHTLQLHDSSTPKTPDSPYRCYHCKETFKSRPELRDHLGTHTDSQETALGSSD